MSRYPRIVRDRLYAHVVWTTRNRDNLIDAKLAEFLCRFLRAVARQERSRILQVGLLQDHVHVLLRYHPTTRLPRLLQRMKGGSAVMAARERRGDLLWNRGYSISSVSVGALESVRAYVALQESRHPERAIPLWKGDVGMLDSREEWQGPDRSSTRVVTRRSVY